jgi:hypothetical protein
MKCSKCGTEYAAEPAFASEWIAEILLLCNGQNRNHTDAVCRDILAERLSECRGDGLAGDPTKWSHFAQIDGLRAQLVAERALREEAERQRDELRACINNYDQMTRAAARQASDADARSSKAERELAAERARSAALQADIASWIRRGSTEDGTELSRYFHHHLAMGEQEGVELANAIESGAWRNALSQPAPTEKKT